MSDIERQILTALVDLLKTGGMYALFGIVGWFLFQLLKIALFGGIVWAITSRLISCVSNIYLMRIYNKSQTYTLLSAKVSKHLMDSIKDFQTQSTQLIDRLLQSVKSANDSSQNSGKTTDKIVSMNSLKDSK